jgi:hypothetical protein
MQVFQPLLWDLSDVATSNVSAASVAATTQREVEQVEGL